MSASRQEIEIRVYHDRRLGIGPFLDAADPFVARRPEWAVRAELAMGYLLWYLTRTQPTRTSRHVCDQLSSAAERDRFDGLRLAGARGLVAVRVGLEPYLGATQSRDRRRDLVEYLRRRTASEIARRLASEGVWTLGARAQELIDDAAVRGYEVDLGEVTDALTRIPTVRVRIADRAPSEYVRRRSPRWAWVSVIADADTRRPPWLLGDAALALVEAARRQIAVAPASAHRFDRALGTATAMLARQAPPVPVQAAIAARARFAMLLAEPDSGP